MGIIPGCPANRNRWHVCFVNLLLPPVVYFMNHLFVLSDEANRAFHHSEQVLLQPPTHTQGFTVYLEGNSIRFSKISRLSVASASKIRVALFA
jgi:hypothetical protein